MKTYLDCLPCFVEQALRASRIATDDEHLIKQDFAVFDYKAFKTNLAAAENILYIGDNAGETVFDKILIKQLKKPVKFAARSQPVINDATMEDAVASGLDEVAELIESGSIAPGTILSRRTPEFLEIYRHADMVISKGQGNYEGLSDEKRTVFFLLKAKCPVIAGDLGVKEGAIVLKGINL